MKHFPTNSVSVPHIGWNGIRVHKKSSLFQHVENVDTESVYFVHSFRALQTDDNKDWVLSTTDYGPDRYIR